MRFTVCDGCTSICRVSTELVATESAIPSDQFMPASIARSIVAKLAMTGPDRIDSARSLSQFDVRRHDRRLQWLLRS